MGAQGIVVVVGPQFGRCDEQAVLEALKRLARLPRATTLRVVYVIDARELEEIMDESGTRCEITQAELLEGVKGLVWDRIFRLASAGPHRISSARLRVNLSVGRSAQPQARC